MPVLYNKDSGLAEDVQDPQSALKAGTHEVPLIDPNGNNVSSSFEDAPNLVSQGYKQPDEAHLNGLLKKAKYSSTGQQLASGVEGAASAMTFGLSTKAELGLGEQLKLMNPDADTGLDQEDINARREANEGSNTIGEIAGLGAGLLTGGTEAMLMEKAGAKAAALTSAKLGANSFAGKVGSAAAKAAVENMMLTSGSEASKAFASDPTQSAESAVANVGLSGVLGGFLGGGVAGTSELWKMSAGKNLGALLSNVKNRAGGIPTELKDMAGIHLEPEVEGALSSNPEAQRAAQVLNEANTKAGTQFQQKMSEFHEATKDATASALGKTPEEISALHDTSDFDAGNKIKDGLVSQLKTEVAPVSEAYEALDKQFSKAPVNEAALSDLSTKVSDLSTELGLQKAPGSSANKLVGRVLSELPLQETAQDLRNYTRNLKNGAPFGSEDYYVAKQISKLIDGARDEAIKSTVGAEAPELLDKFQDTQKAYGQVKELIETLNDRLHAGKSGGPESFMQNIKDMQPEDVVRRLSTKSDAELQSVLNEKFPWVSESVKQHELNKVLKASLDKAGEKIDPKKLFKKIQAMQPEQRSYLINQESQGKLDAIKGLLDRVPTKMNGSGTARTLDALWDNIPASATAVASMVMGHNPAIGFILGKAATYIGKEAPDALRMSMLKFLGSEMPVNAAAFKESVTLAEQALKGEKLLNKVSTSVFESSASPLKEPSSADLEKLAKQIDAVILHPDKLMDITGEAGHYMPDHAAGVSAASSRAVQYLAGLKPVLTPTGVLDKARVASNQENSDYKAALRIAENPMLVLKSVKDGSLTPKELQHINAMYPGLVGRMQTHVSSALMDQVHAGKPIPFKTQMAVSMFMAQPLSSALQPQSIQMNQMTFAPKPPPGANPQQHRSMGGNKNALTKMPQAYLTPQQNRSLSKTGKQ